MGLRYGNRASTGAAGALCCDNRGFAGGDIHSIINNPPPTAAHAAHKNTSTHMRESTYKLRNTHIHKEHVFLIPSFPCYIIFTQHHNQDYIHTHTHIHTRVHTQTIMRRPSLLQHMLGCLAEATLTACLTAASVCYEHGPVSTPLSSSSLRPPLLYASLLVLSVLPPSLSSMLTRLWHFHSSSLSLF